MAETETLRTEEAGFACRCPSCGFTLEEASPPLEAITVPAHAFILAHNHPSGSLRASEDDRAFTTRMRDAAELLGFALLDHILVARGNPSFVSFKESGWC